MNAAHRHPTTLLLPALIYLLSPLILLAIGLRLLSGRPLPGLAAKLGRSQAGCTPPHFLIHGVSLGEIRLIQALLPGLERLLGQPAVISTSTASGRSAADTHFTDRPRRYLPFDLPWAVGPFLDRLQPSLVLLMELELWPLLLLACQRRRIPVLLLGARLSERSYRGYRRWRALLRPAFAAISGVIAQNALWGARFRALGIAPVAIGGSLKAALVQPASARQVAALRQRLRIDPVRPLFLIASTSGNEEEALLRSFLTWGDGWQVVLCPRHPDRGPELVALCARLGCPAIRSSSDEHTATARILVVDEIGHLSALYACASLCVVGGSLGSGRHGQNMLEACANRCCTVVGWDTSNFPDAMCLLRHHEGVVEVSAETLAPTLAALASDPARRARIAAAGYAAWASDHGALERNIHLLGQLLARRSPRG